MAIQKFTCFSILISALTFIGCGGGSLAPSQVSPHVIVSAEVFSNTPQTWNFKDGFGHSMTIDVMPLACAFGSCGDITVWHYTKDSCAGYWNPRTPEQCSVATSLDELYFVLRHDADGAWRCIGFTYIDYLSRKWKVQILQQPGKAPAYTIIPAASNVSDPPTAYDAIVQQMALDVDLTDFSPINAGVNFSATWQTLASVDNGELVSDQHENCVNEPWKYNFKGLREVKPKVNIGNNGVCLTMDDRFTMIRQ